MKKMELTPFNPFQPLGGWHRTILVRLREAAMGGGGGGAASSPAGARLVCAAIVESNYFPRWLQELLKIRLVSRTWNEAALGELGRIFKSKGVPTLQLRRMLLEALCTFKNDSVPKFMAAAGIANGFVPNEFFEYRTVEDCGWNTSLSSIATQLKTTVDLSKIDAVRFGPPRDGLGGGGWGLSWSCTNLFAAMLVAIDPKLLGDLQAWKDGENRVRRNESDHVVSLMYCSEYVGFLRGIFVGLVTARRLRAPQP